MGSTSQEILRSFCSNTEWKYAVFWKLNHPSRMILTLEDAYYDNHGHNNSPKNMHGAHDPLGLALAKMAYHVYSLGEGIVGHVAVSGEHQWVFPEYYDNWYSASEFHNVWESQISAAIKTILVVPVGPCGVVQLGSLLKVDEDVTLVNHIKHMFLALKDPLPDHEENLVQCNMNNSFYLPKLPSECSHVEAFPNCSGEVGKAMDVEESSFLTQYPNLHPYLKNHVLNNTSSSTLAIDTERLITDQSYPGLDSTFHTLSTDNEKSSRFDALISSGYNFPGSELLEALGSGFKQTSRGLEELVKSEHGSATRPTDDNMSHSQLTFDSAPENLLDAVVANVCHSEGNARDDIFSSKSVQSFLTSMEMAEPSGQNKHIVSNLCNNNEDINFRFTGFTLSGKVLGAVGGESCMIKNGGPADVNVELLSSDGDPIASVLTSSDGSYLFKNIIPGKYSIRASHPELQVEVRGSTEVELGFANGLVDDIFFVLGYDLKGSVVAQGNPILGVHIYLHSDDVSMVDCPQGLGDASGERKPLCHAISDADGIFSFKSIPCGKYELIPHYKGENTVFDVSPPVMPVSVEHQHVNVPTKFQVTGFSIGGRVVDSNLKGVEGVKIVVDGNLRSVTDNEGYYKLDQVTSNQYTIDAVKEHYKFDKLKKFMVLPNMASLPDISAVSYDVCGVVRMFGSGHKANVALTHGPTNVKPQKKLTDESGKFCFEVPPGEYRLSAFAATPKSAPELLFLPGYMDVSVKSPLLNIEFSQARVNVHGSVTCKEKCGPSVSVALVGAAGDRDKKTVVLTDESSQFHFSDILPGKYRVEVKSISPEAISEEDTWCWDRSSIDVNVGTEDIKGIEFVQKGYWINIVSTHEVDAKIVHPSGSPTNLKIKKGLQKICVESPGAHELQLSDSCISFASNSIKIDVSNPQPIHLRAEKYLIKGLINVESSSTEIESELPESFIVDMQDEEGRVINSISAKLASVGSGVYEYYTWAKLGEKISFVPRDSRGNAEKKMLFYPKELRAVVANDGCQAAVSPFAGRPGLYIQGSVSPPLPGVNIKVSAGKDSHISSLKKGEVAVETSTSPDGSFVAGPLYDDIPYDTDASKPGYHIKRLGPYSFSCQKLGQISVRVSSKDNAETSIPPLLLSLSGDHGYRNNSISGAGGLFVFDSLFPGNFYLRPLLKEYSFKPSTLAIELGSGESSEAVFEATRVAYSAMGRVALLSGQPQEGVAIEARSDSKGYYEETTSDIDGNYRLRGLHPGATYVIKVSKRNGSGKNNIERASPESVSLQIGYEDIHGVDFLVFEQPETTILTCHVEGKQHEEINTNLLVEIKSASDVSKIENVFPLPLSNFFQVKGLSRGKHLVQLKSNRPLGSHKVVSEIIEVDFETNAQIHVGPLRYSIEADQQSQEVTPAAILPLVTGIAAIALFISIPRLKDIYQSTVGFSAPGFSASSTKREPRKAVARKKTF